MMKKLISMMILGLAVSQSSMAMEDREKCATSVSRKLTFKDGCEITLQQNDTITIKDAGGILTFNEENKPIFRNLGEAVIEYSGSAVDGNVECSWAKASFDPRASSPAHFHKERTEDYYITSENAKVLVVVGDVEHRLSTGDCLKILPNQRHQVTNLSSSDPFSLVVKCVPAWVFEDYNLCK